MRYFFILIIQSWVIFIKQIVPLYRQKSFKMTNSLTTMTSSSTKRITTTESTSKLVNSQTRCSLQEGVRMMVTPSMFMTGPSPPPPVKEGAILNPPVTVQKAIGVTQPLVATTKIISSITSSHQSKVMGESVVTTESIKISKTNGRDGDLRYLLYYIIFLPFFFILNMTRHQQLAGTTCHVANHAHTWPPATHR